MSKIIYYYLGIAVTLIGGTILYSNSSCNCTSESTTKNKVADANFFTRSENHVPFRLVSAGFRYKTNYNFNFIKSNEALVLPVSDSVLIGIVNLKDYLTSYPNYKIKITGYALNDEQNNSNYRSLAEARAIAVKEYMLEHGYYDSQFELAAYLVSSLTTNYDTILGPVKFDIIRTTTPNKELTIDGNTLKSRINSNPLILNYDSGDSQELVSPDADQKINSIKQYLRIVPNAKVLAIGHTDIYGTRELNITVGKQRAEYAKIFLLQKGISLSRIETMSRGEEEPLSYDLAPESQAINRRVVVQIK